MNVGKGSDSVLSNGTTNEKMAMSPETTPTATSAPTSRLLRQPREVTPADASPQFVEPIVGDLPTLGEVDALMFVEVGQRLVLEEEGEDRFASSRSRR